MQSPFSAALRYITKNRVMVKNTVTERQTNLTFTTSDPGGEESKLGSQLAFFGFRCQVLMSRFQSTNSSHQQKTQGQCRIHGTNDVVKDTKFTGCVTGEFVHHSHANARKRSFMPGAQNQPRLKTLIF